MSAPTRSPLGLVVGDRYRISRHIGSGGQGIVYEAEDQRRPGDFVAVKLLHEQFSEGSDEYKRFGREAKIMRKVVSPYVARVHAAGLEQGDGSGALDGRFWIAFELLVGESLSQVLRRRHQLGVTEVFAIMNDVLQGLERAHAAGVVHRDIKPSNILICVDPARACIVDFGVAKQVGDGALTSAGLTVTGHIIGTPSYMAPEQLLSSRDVDGRADLFSIALVGYVALCGRIPPGRSQKDGFQPLVAIPRLEHLTLTKWPEPIEGWFAHMLHPIREYRFPTAMEARRALLDVMAGAGGWDVVAASELEGAPPDLENAGRPDLVEPTEINTATLADHSTVHPRR